MTIRPFSGEAVELHDFDVLIIGSGPAGLAVATELMASNLQVAVLESGNIERSEEADALNDFECVGQNRAKFHDVGCRVLGGSTLLWTGRCGTLDSIDFHTRPWLPLSGWPIDSDILAPHYQRAGTFLGLAPTRPPESGMVELRQSFDSPPVEEAVFKPVLWQFSRSVEDLTSTVRHFTPEGTTPSALLQHTGGSTPVHVGTKFSSALQESQTVHVFTSATVVEIHADPITGSVTGATTLGKDGTPKIVKAPRVVLACGGIQNARLLLASRTAQANGLGNMQDQVGRYLCDHTFTEIAVFGSSAGKNIRRRLGSRWHPQLDTTRGHVLGLRLSEELQRRNQVLNAAIHLIEYGSELNPLSMAASAVRGLKNGAHKESLRGLGQALSRPTALATGAYDRMIARRPPLNRPTRSVVGCVTEQELLLNSRVTLSDRCDRFGQPIAQINWQISEREFDTVLAVENAFHAEALRLNESSYDRPSWIHGDFKAWKQDLLDLAHPSCTTRMASDPANGVVDANCEVHGVRGLYVAGSSVFASNGHMNPTQTIVALALRLADHIRTELRPRVVATPKTLIEVEATAGEHRCFRFGIVGGGNRVETVYAPVMKALFDSIEVCGVVTRTSESAMRISEQTGWSTTTDLDEMIAEGQPDAIIVVTPPSTNSTIYPALVKLGIPLFLETPFCWNERQGRHLLKAIDTCRLMVSVGEQFPFMPEAQLMRRLISLGYVGRVDVVENDFALYDYHSIAMLRMLMGRQRRPVRAQGTWKRIGHSDERWLTGAVTCEDGGLMLHRFSPHFEKHTHRGIGNLRVYGTHGTLSSGEARFGSDGLKVLISPILREIKDSDLKRLSVETPDGELEWKNPFFGHMLDDQQIAVAHLVSEMADAVQSSGVPPYPARSALEDVELINALQYSADRSGIELSLPVSGVAQKVLIRAQKKFRPTA